MKKKNLTHTIRFPLPNIFNLHIIPPCLDILRNPRKKKHEHFFSTQFLYFISVINLKESLICLMLCYTKEKKIFSCIYTSMYYTPIIRTYGRRNSSEDDFEKCEYIFLYVSMRMRNAKIVIICWNFFDWTFFLNGLSNKHKGQFTNDILLVLGRGFSQAWYISYPVSIGKHKIKEEESKKFGKLKDCICYGRSLRGELKLFERLMVVSNCPSLR